MSVVVSVAFSVAEGDTTLVQVVRAETVLQVSADGTEVDLVDLTHAALDRLGAEASSIASEQITALRALLGS